MCVVWGGGACVCCVHFYECVCFAMHVYTYSTYLCMCTVYLCLYTHTYMLCGEGKCKAQSSFDLKFDTFQSLPYQDII